jgi:hypothetical protein
MFATLFGKKTNTIAKPCKWNCGRHASGPGHRWSSLCTRCSDLAWGLDENGVARPESFRASDDEDLRRELAMWAKEMKRQSGLNELRQDAKQIADAGQLDEWELRKQSVAAYKTGDFARGDALEREANRIGENVVHLRVAAKDATDDY